MSLTEYATPDVNNRYNFVFDTCVLEKRLSRDIEIVRKCQAKLIEGFRFYVTEVQFRELNGFPDRKYTYHDPSSWKPSVYLGEINKIANMLDIKRISCVSTLLPNFTLLDGTFREFLDLTSQPISKMLYEIHNENKNHLRDAVTAEAAIHNNCIYISMDDRPIRIINKHFPNRAFHYDQFIKSFLS